MRDKRPVDELTVEELERVLAIRKREQRQQGLKRMRASGRVVATQEPAPDYAPQANGHVTTENGSVKKARPAADPAPQFDSPPVGNALVAETVTLADGSWTQGAPRFEEDIAPDADTPASSTTDDGDVWKVIINRALLLVEVGAVAALVFLGVNLFGAIGDLQSETQEAQRLAQENRDAARVTPEPTSIISVRVEDFVLPGGHTLETDAETGQVTAQFNFDEFIDDVPDHLVSSVQSQAYAINIDFRRPEPTTSTALYVTIPKLNIDDPITQGTDWEALKSGVGQVLNNTNPGDQTGNVVLAAHNDIYGERFRDLPDLEVGDEILVHTENETFIYRVTGFDIVEPTDVHVMFDQGAPTATLITCYPYGVNTHRYVVFAERVDGVEF